LNGDTRFSFGEFALLVGGSYQFQSVSKKSADVNYSFINPKGGLEYNPSKNFRIKAGAKYFSYDIERLLGPNLGTGIVKENLIVPWGTLEFGFNNNLSISVSYDPGVEFKTYNELLEENAYTHINQDLDMDLGTDNDVTNYNHKVRAVLKYGYKKYYELSIGGTYFTADDYSFFNPDFSFDNTPGWWYKFHIDRWDDVTGYSIFANALYHLGPFGWFYSDAQYQVVETSFSNIDVVIPYKPKFSVSAIYGYDFAFGLSTELKLHYLKDTYADLQNIVKLDDYINLSANLRYSLTESFDFTLHLNNLLNRDNYLWLGYLESPFDFTAGIDFRF
jgi:outer membrane receptor protein involved in Fe transport